MNRTGDKLQNDQEWMTRKQRKLDSLGNLETGELNPVGLADVTSLCRTSLCRNSSYVE